MAVICSSPSAAIVLWYNEIRQSRLGCRKQIRGGVRFYPNWVTTTFFAITLIHARLGDRNRFIHSTQHPPP